MRTALLVPFVLTVYAGCSEAETLDLGPGVGTSPDAGAPHQDGGTVACDDGDPCTDDRIVAGACLHEPIADGSPCDDGDPCTHADVCQVGACRGVAGADGPPRVLSTSRPRFRGTGRAVGSSRYLFATRRGPGSGRTFVVLTRAGADGFDVLDELQVSEVPRDFISLGPDLAAGLTQSGAQFLDLSGDRLRLRGRAQTGAPPNSGAFRSGRLFLCVARDQLARELWEFDAADLDAPLSLGTNPGAGGCLSVASASLGDGAYATVFPSRLIRLVPRPTQTSVVEDLSLAADAVHANAGFLTLATGASGVRLVDEQDLSEVGSVQGAWVRSARYTSRGLEVYIQETDTLELIVYDVEVGGSPALRPIAREPIATGTAIRGSATGWGSHNEGLRIAEINKVFLLNDRPPFLREIQDPDSSWPGAMYVRGSDIFLRDDQRAVRIDASDPTAPRSIAGGLHGATRDAVALEFEGGEAVGLFGDQFRASALGVVDDVDFFLVGLLPEAPLVARVMDADQRGTDLSQHDLDFSQVVGRRDRLGLVGTNLYRIQRPREDGREAQLDRWAANDFIASTAPRSSLSRIIRSPSGDSFGVFARLHDDTAIAFSTTTDNGQSALYWTELTETADPVGPFRVPWAVVDIATHEDRMVVVGVRHTENVDREVYLLTLERRGNALREVSARSWVPAQTIVGGRRILSFDGQFVYLNFLDGPPGRVGNALVGLRATDLDGPLADYPLPNATIADGFEVAPWGLVLSADETLVIAEPWCDEPAAPLAERGATASR